MSVNPCVKSFGVSVCPSVLFSVYVLVSLFMCVCSEKILLLYMCVCSEMFCFFMCICCKMFCFMCVL